MRAREALKLTNLHAIVSQACRSSRRGASDSNFNDMSFWRTPLPMVDFEETWLIGCPGQPVMHRNHSRAADKIVMHILVG